MDHTFETPASLEREETRETALERLRSAGNITLSPELFEKLYLQPQTSVKGDLRKVFGNPTPLGLVGFVIGLTPLSCNLMGLRGSGGGGAANIGDYFFIGGPLLMISGLLEFILGNSFTFVVFVTYGAIFLTLAASLQPFYNAAGAYSQTGLDNLAGAQTPAFNSSFAFFLISVAALNILFIIMATRINIVFLLVFTGAFLGFVLAASARWCLAEGSTELAGRLVVGTGAAWFATSMGGWYLLAIQLFSLLEFPITLPVGDLTHFWANKSKSGGSQV